MRAILAYNLSVWFPKKPTREVRPFLFFSIHAQHPLTNSRFGGETGGSGISDKRTWRFDTSGTPEFNLASRRIYFRGSSSTMDSQLCYTPLTMDRVAAEVLVRGLHADLKTWADERRISLKMPHVRPFLRGPRFQAQLYRAFFELPSFKQDDEERMLTPHWDDLNYLVERSFSANLNQTFWV